MSDQNNIKETETEELTEELNKLYNEFIGELNPHPEEIYKIVAKNNVNDAITNILNILYPEFNKIINKDKYKNIPDNDTSILFIEFVIASCISPFKISLLMKENEADSLLDTICECHSPIN